MFWCKCRWWWRKRLAISMIAVCVCECVNFKWNTCIDCQSHKPNHTIWNGKRFEATKRINYTNVRMHLCTIKIVRISSISIQFVNCAYVWLAEQCTFSLVFLLLFSIFKRKDSDTYKYTHVQCACVSVCYCSRLPGERCSIILSADFIAFLFSATAFSSSSSSSSFVVFKVFSYCNSSMLWAFFRRVTEHTSLVVWMQMHCWQLQ